MHSTSWGTEAETLGSLMMFPSGVCTTHHIHDTFFITYCFYYDNSNPGLGKRQNFTVNVSASTQQMK